MPKRKNNSDNNNNSSNRNVRRRRNRGYPKHGDSSTGSSNTNALVVSNNAVLRHTRLSVPRGVAMFPDEFYTQGRTIDQISSSITSVGGPNFFSWKANGCMFNGGPSPNGGSFNANVPSGAAYLLGSSGPYSTCWTMDVEIAITASGSGASSFLTLLPSLNGYGSIVSLTTQQLAEQRGAVQILIPGTTNAPVKLEAKFKPWDIFGIDQHTYLNNIIYGQTPGADPTQLAYWHLIHSTTPTASDSLEILVTTNIKFKFAGLNVLSSIQPS